MTGPILLLSLSLKRARTLLVATGLLLAAFQVLLVLIATLMMVALMMAGTWVGLAMLAPDDAQWPSPMMIGSLALNLGMLMLCWSSVALALAAACRRSVASATTGLLALAALLLDLTARLWPAAEPFAWLSPFRYFIPFDLVMGTALPVENILVLWAIAMSGFTVAYLLFSQRDISH